MRRALAVVAALISVVGISTAAPIAAASASDVGHSSSGRHSSSGARPDPVRGVRAYDLGNGAVAVHWTNPATPFRKVSVRYRRGEKAPRDPKHGAVGHLQHGKSTSATLRHLVSGARYSVSVWTRASGRTISARRTVHFTTAPAARSTGAGTLQGRVVDDQGHPLHHAVVYLYRTADEAFFVARTDVQGRYRLHLPAATYRGGIWGPDATGGDSDASGYQLRGLTVHVRPGSTTTVNGALTPGGRVSGRVTDTSGHPLAGVETNLLRAPYLAFPVRADAEDAFFDQLWDIEPGTPANGRYSIGGLPRGAFVICYDTSVEQVVGGTSDQSGYASDCQREPVGVAPHASVTVPDMALLATPGGGGSITGTVTDPSGRPVADADLYAQLVGKRYASAESYSDQDGHYQFSGLVPGTYKICALTDTAAPPSSGLGGSSGCLSGHVKVSAGAISKADFRLREAAGIEGTVTGPNGRPVRGAYVTISHSRWETDYVAQTDSSGHFVARTVSPGRWRICFDTSGSRVPGLTNGAAPGCLAHRHLIRLTRGRIRLGMDATLTRGAAVQVRTQEAAGHALPNTAVELTTADGTNGDVFMDQVTDRSGTTTFTGLPGGAFDVCARIQQRGNTAVSHCGRPIKVKPGRLRRHTMTFPVADNSVQVTVRDSSGRPVSGADAVLLQPCGGQDWSCAKQPLFSKNTNASVTGSEITAGHGQAQFDGLRSGNYAVCLLGYWAATSANDAPTGYADSCTTYGTFDVTTSNGNLTSVSMTLAHAGAVTGTVTDDQNRPIQNALVTVTGSAADDIDLSDALVWVPGEYPQYTALSSADGSFALRSVKPGEQQVCVKPSQATGPSATGYIGTCLPGKVSIAADSTTEGVHIEPAEAGAISGTVTSEAGAPLRFADVGVFRDGKYLRDALTKKDGSYAIKRLEAGDYVVCVARSGFRPECYDDVPYPHYQTEPPPSDATVVTVSGGASTAVDAVLTSKS